MHSFHCRQPAARVHKRSELRHISSSHTLTTCDVLMMTAAALQASLPFVCSASCAIEVINAIIRYAGRVYVCTSIVTHT